MKNPISILLILSFILVIGVFFINSSFAKNTTEVVFTKPLQLGVKNDQVRQLQEFLKLSPDIYPQGIVTGYFGSLTREAVRKFQKKYGIPSIGIIGPKTIAKLNELFVIVTNTSTIPAILVTTDDPVSSTTTPSTATTSPSLPTATTSPSLPTATTSPSFSVSLTTLSFSGIAGGVAPASQSVSITNTTTGTTLNWTTASSATWLTVTPISGTNNGTITVTANQAGLAAGTYTGTITITATGATGSPYVVNVTFTVAPAIDLVAYGFQSVPSNIKTGASFKANFYILNNSVDTSPPGKVEFYYTPDLANCAKTSVKYGDYVYSFSPIPGALASPPSGPMIIFNSGNMVAPTGYYKFVEIVDPYNQIIETNKSNNSFCSSSVKVTR